jgi:hypothetical protein
MRCIRITLAALLITSLLPGCGSNIRARGRVVKNGQVFPLKAGEGLRIFFVPAESTSESSWETYAAVYNKDDGTFVVAGKNGNGLPPGKYRVALEHVKNRNDLFKGTYGQKQSPIFCEVAGSQEIVVDLSSPTAPAGGAAPAATPVPQGKHGRRRG